MKPPIIISESWCKQFKKDFTAEIKKYESQGWVIYDERSDSTGKTVHMYLPVNNGDQGSNGFTKKEQVLKDFTAALLSNSSIFRVSESTTLKEGFKLLDYVRSFAKEATAQYFLTLKTLNDAET